MFSLIYCFLPLLLSVFHVYLIKKRKSLSWNIRKGEICYHCKDSLNLSDDLILKRLLDPKNYCSLCVSCNRDRKIQQIKRPYLKWKFKMFNSMVSENTSKFNIIFIAIIFLLIALDIVLISVGIKFRLWPVYGTLNLLFYFFSIYKTFYTTSKK
jgi:hypothetical protein